MGDPKAGRPQQKAMTRDTSQFNRLNTTPKKFHIANERGEATCHGYPLSPATAVSPTAVPMGLQCNAIGCIGGFIEAEQGEPDERTPLRMLPARVRGYVVESDTGCWLWTGPINQGYGRIRVAGRQILVHRLVYEHLVGPIPDDLCIDHLCMVRHCCNPSHLEVVTLAENTRRGLQHRYRTSTEA